jgi:hypothetical protein
VIFFLAKSKASNTIEVMEANIYVPRSLRDAGKQIRVALQNDLATLPRREFVRAWCALAYLFPGLHPDGYEDADSGWPRVLKRFAAEAWRRADAGELADDELYACDAQWSGLFDRMLVHLPEETERRVELAASYGLPTCG